VAVPLAVRLRWVSLNRLYIPRNRLSLFLSLLERFCLNQLRAVDICLFDQFACRLTGTRTAQRAERQPMCAIEPWQPWSAHEPFADEITRWWPSDEVPCEKEIAILEPSAGSLQPQLVLWPANGGLLDTWG